jgi:putative hydrolase
MPMMIDLHTHTLFSDGELIPSELVRRVEAMGYLAVALTDHGDSSTIDFSLPRIIRVAEELNQIQSVKVIPGVELTHIPPPLIGKLVQRARELGAALVVVHGETIVEPVAPGTNLAAIESGVDILAHPGLITAHEAALAAHKGVFLEISGRSGHSFTNGHVASRARAAGARLILNSDAHKPGDLMSVDFARKVVEGAGLPEGSLNDLLANSNALLQKVGYPL